MQYLSDSEDTALFDYHKQTGMEQAEYDEVMEALMISIPNFRNEVTVQTISRLAAWSSAWSSNEVPKNVGDKPVLQIYAIREEYEHIRKTQEEIWCGLTGPKERHYEDRGHLDILTPEGDQFTQLMKVQVDFVHKHLATRMV